MDGDGGAPPPVGGGEVFASLAWLGAEKGLVPNVLVRYTAAGLISDVRPGVAPSTLEPGVVRLGGDLALPGFVNAHSHAFHRVLRGISETRSGDFWTWRDLMYSVAEQLAPESYHQLAIAVYAEMLLAGYTAVGEFHYLHHQSGGAPYAEPNVMGLALIGAAGASGIRMTLLDTCYLQAGVGGRPLQGPQLRFGDLSGSRWAERAGRLAEALWSHDNLRLGAAIHSVRAVPPSAMATVATLAHDMDWPLHVHLSEQRRENEECLQLTGCTPTALLDDAGAVGPSMTAVHATHLTASDLALLGSRRCSICACPTTERDLGDGIGRFSALAEAGAMLSIGSDSHAVIDPFEETRAIELDERLAAERRGIWQVPALLEAATSGGCRSLGWPEAGIAPGGVADLVTLRLGSLRLTGAASSEELLARVVFAAHPSDVHSVVVGGKVVVAEGEHLSLGPPRAVAELLARSAHEAAVIG
ncbi:MAG: formimidoylglutamate deiminase [Acidimicrobiales bacterium]